MTKRQRQSRLRQVQEELLGFLKGRFPRAEFIGTAEWPNGRFIIEVYTPHDDEFDIIRSVASRLVDLSLNEGLHISVFPTREKPDRRAA